MPEEILAGTATPRFPAEQLAEEEPVTPSCVSCHVSTQTSWPVTDSDAHTDLKLAQHLSLDTPASAGPVEDGSASLRQSSPTQTAPDTTVKECFQKLTKERQHHYTAIRSKLEHMVTTLSRRQELADVTNVTQGLGTRIRQRIHKDSVQEPNPRLPVESAGIGTWPRARCVH